MCLTKKNMETEIPMFNMNMCEPYSIINFLASPLEFLTT